MAEQNGYIKIDRNIVNWRWWNNRNTLIVFLTILLKANYKDLTFEGRTIHRGQFVTSTQSLAESTGLSTQTIRTCLMHLISTGEITSESTNRYRIITVVNYDKYQEPTGKSTGNQQTTNRQSTDNQQQVNTRNTRNTRKKEKGVADAPSPSGTPERGSKLWKAKAHLLLTADEGTVEDIPDDYRDMFTNFADYWRFRNQ